MKDHFFKYMSSEVSKIVLTNSTLRYTHPNNFNDPFDYYPTSNKIGANKFVKRVLSEQSSDKKTKKANFKTILNHSHILRSIAFRNITAKMFCVTCFSRTPFSLPMWAHYANNHDGCVIEFRQVSEIEAEKAIQTSSFMQDSFYLVPFDVTYTDERPLVFDENGLTNTTSNGFYSALIKAKSWEYEQEVRVIKTTRSGDFPFNTAQIKAVYIGMKVPSKTALEISSIIKEINKNLGLSIKIHKVVMEHNTFKLTSVRF